MLTFTGARQRLCDGLSRRQFLKVGALGVGCLTLADLLRARAQAAPSSSRQKAIIMAYLNGGPGFLGIAHQPYRPGSRGGDLGLTAGMTLDRLAERRTMLATFDNLRRELDDARGRLAGMDAFTTQALEMVVSNRARDAFDI